MRTAGTEAGATGQDPFLAYHCPKLRSEHLRSPCGSNLAKAKELRQKFSNALLGPLEHCAACKGRDLVVREAPVSHFEQKTELGPGHHNDLVAPQIEEKLNDLDEASPLCLNEESMEPAPIKEGPPAGTPAPPDPSPAPIKGQFCKNHPEVESKKAKNGVYMGRCVSCLAAVAAKNSRNRGAKADKEKMTPAVARDLARKKAATALTGGNMAGVVAFKDEREAAKVLGSGFPGSPEPVPICNNPHDPPVPAQIDKRGRSTGYCPACLSLRGRKMATETQQAGTGVVPFSIPLNRPEYKELKAWLIAQAEELEQDLPRQIIYRLKLAMREASPLG